MVKEPEKDPTKSITWLSLQNETQENIIRVTDSIQNETNAYRQGKNETELSDFIHKALGCKSGYYPALINRLEMMTERGEGAIFDQMKEYISKYKTIESAALQIIKEKNLSRERTNS